MLTQLRPPDVVIRCDLQGCRWRILLPWTCRPSEIGERLLRLGWFLDGDSIVCLRHKLPVFDA